jgi:hypothetical protein
MRNDIREIRTRERCMFNDMNDESETYSRNHIQALHIVQQFQRLWYPRQQNPPNHTQVRKENSNLAGFDDVYEVSVATKYK